MAFKVVNNTVVQDDSKVVVDDLYVGDLNANIVVLEQVPTLDQPGGKVYLRNVELDNTVTLNDVSFNGTNVVFENGLISNDIIDAGGNRIINVGEPVIDGDATNKLYVDTQVLALADEVAALTTDNIAEGTINLYYTDARAQLANEAIIQAAEANAIFVSNAYTDLREQAITTAYQLYTDTAEADAIATANAYTDAAEADAIATANAYSDAQDVLQTAALEAYTDQAEADAITSSNAYTDTQNSIQTAVLQVYADQAEADAIATSQAYTSGQVTALTTYVDSRLDTLGNTVSNLTTDDIAEGTNLYYTDTRVRNAISASDGITYNNTTGGFTLTDTGVVAGTYGSSSEVPVISVDANGRLTSATTTPVAGVASLTYDEVNGSITIGTSAGTTFSVDLGIGSADTPAFTTLETTGDAVIGGNLTVNGTVTTVNTETIALADNIITLNSNAVGVATESAGIEVERGDDTNVSLIWDEANNKWTVGTETFVAATFEGNLVGNVTGNVNGNTSTATALQTARTITLAGDVSGSTTFDGTANVTITSVVANDSHTHTSSTISDATNTNTPNVIVKRDASGNFSAGVITASLSGNATTATRLATPRTISLAGDVSGSTTFDGSANATINVVIADDSHNHVIANVDGLQTALDSKQYKTYIQDTAPAGIVDGDLWWDSAEGLLNIRYAGTWVEASPASASLSQGSGSLLDSDFLDGQDGAYYLNFANFTNLPDPTITLTGAVTGSATMTNLGNVTIATTATADPTLTINGDASGSATFTNLGNATLTLTIADDSHNHIIANVDGLQAALDSKQPAGSYVTTATTFGGDVSGTYNNIVVANDSHTHDGRYYTEAEVNTLLAGKQNAGSYLTTTTGFGGDVSGTYNSIVVADDSHRHTYLYNGATIRATATTSGLSVNGSIVASGDVTAYSDKRFKHDIVTIDSALDKVSKMRGVEYTMNETRSVGVVAQEVEEVVPELIRTDENGMKSVAYGNMAGVFIEAIKELKEEIASLKAEIEELRNGN